MSWEDEDGDRDEKGFVWIWNELREPAPLQENDILGPVLTRNDS